MGAGPTPPVEPWLTTGRISHGSAEPFLGDFIDEAEDRDDTAAVTFSSERRSMPKVSIAVAACAVAGLSVACTSAPPGPPPARPATTAPAPKATTTTTVGPVSCPQGRPATAITKVASPVPTFGGTDVWVDGTVTNRATAAIFATAVRLRIASGNSTSPGVTYGNGSQIPPGMAGKWRAPLFFPTGVPVDMSGLVATLTSNDWAWASPAFQACPR
jgi:hypothetical protein